MVGEPSREEEQRHYDSYVLREYAGRLLDEDRDQLELALRRAREGEVDPVPAVFRSVLGQAARGVVRAMEWSPSPQEMEVQVQLAAEGTKYEVHFHPRGKPEEWMQVDFALVRENNGAWTGGGVTVFRASAPNPYMPHCAPFYSLEWDENSTPKLLFQVFIG